MSIMSNEKGRLARNVRALGAAIALGASLLSTAYRVGAADESRAIATQEHYTKRHTTEQAALQAALDRDTPAAYTSGGRKLVPEVTYIANFPQTIEAKAPMLATRNERKDNSKNLLFVGLAALVAALGADVVARHQRIGAQLTTYQNTDTQALYYMPRPTAQEIPVLPAPIPQVYGTPPPPTLRERRAAQLEVSTQPYDPFAVGHNHEAIGLTISIAPAIA